MKDDASRHNSCNVLTITKMFSMVIALFLSGCYMGELSRRAFIDNRNFEIGRSVNSVHALGPVSVKQIDDHMSEYLFEIKETGCQWQCIVDIETKKVISWRFISNPELCYYKFDFSN